MGMDLELLYAGATRAPPSGLYFSLQELADQLNDELEYIKSDLTTQAYRANTHGFKRYRV